MEKIGAIDIGTNSMRIFIGKVENGRIVEGFKDLRTTRMGENVDKTGKLSTDAINRNIDALKEFINIAKNEGISHMPIIATSAVRDAKNKETFIKRAKEEVGVNIEVITGEREAELGFLGVLRGLKEKNKNILVLDIGGGSTEFIFGNESGIKHLISINIGAVRMTEKFVTTDPICKKEIQHMIKAIDQSIEKTIHDLKKFKIDTVIGIGGTATTIAAVSQKLNVYDREKIHNFEIKQDEVKRILDLFLSKNLKERKQMAGLQPKRADIIPAGTIILDRILTGLRIDAIKISEYDNLEGLVFDQIDKRLDK